MLGKSVYFNSPLQTYNLDCVQLLLLLFFIEPEKKSNTYILVTL